MLKLKLKVITTKEKMNKSRIKIRTTIFWLESKVES